jgi:hypothetical protein
MKEFNFIMFIVVSVIGSFNMFVGLKYKDEHMQTRGHILLAWGSLGMTILNYGG